MKHKVGDRVRYVGKTMVKKGVRMSSKQYENAQGIIIGVIYDKIPGEWYYTTIEKGIPFLGEVLEPVKLTGVGSFEEMMEKLDVTGRRDKRIREETQ